MISTAGSSARWSHPRSSSSAIPALPFWRTADLRGPAIALGQAIGRVGCFMAGDDYGAADAACHGR